jgi:hypothetical protein
MQPLFLLDFDGVLFNSAYEAYQVCEHLASGESRYRQGLSFDEFMIFRAQLTDAWQFCRLYHKERILRDVSKLHEVEPDIHDWRFAEEFFEARAEMMKDLDWPKLMSPYPFFHQLRPLLIKYPETFKILSTRNKLSIQRTLEFFEADAIEIYGQEDIREHGSKLAVAKHKNWLGIGRYVIYIDDMNPHLEPFETQVDLCIHAGWGYDIARVDSYTQGQAFQIISGFLKVAKN